MARMKRIDRKACRCIVELAVEAAAKVLKREGLTVEQTGGARFDESQVTFKIKATVATQVSQNDERDSRLLGFSENIIGKSFQIRRTIHTITGINMNRWKFPVSTKTQNGAGYKFPVSEIERHLGLKIPKAKMVTGLLKKKA